MRSAATTPSRGRDAHTQARIMRAQVQRGWDRANDPRLTCRDELILLTLERRQILGYGSQDLTAQVLATQARCTIRHVRRCLARLEAWGYVEITEHRRRNGGQCANSYRVRRCKGITPKDILARRRARAERDRYRKAGLRFDPETGEVVEPCLSARSRGGGLTFGTTSLTRARVDPPRGRQTTAKSGVEAPSARSTNPAAFSDGNMQPFNAREWFRNWQKTAGDPGRDVGGGSP